MTTFLRQAPAMVPVLLALALLGACKTVPPGDDLFWVLLSKDSDEEVQAQVLLPEETQVVIVPVVGDLTTKWDLLQPRITVNRDLAERIAAGEMAFQLTQRNDTHTERFVPK